MLQLAKRVGIYGLTLIFVLTLLPLSVFRVNAAESNSGTMVESTLNFNSMTSIAEGSNAEEKAASKASAKQALLNAGAVDADNLFLKGNHETIVNPGGYNGPGYFIQKAEAAPGETIQNATLSLNYWVCTAEPQGYLEVYASADNQSYVKVFEQREGNGDPYSYSTKQSTSVALPVSEGQTVIYIKAVMEHWSTYEGSAVACSTITLNRDAKQYEPVETDKTPEECTMVTQTYSFNSLTNGEVSAEDIGAVEELNLFFGIDDVPLLSPRNGYEIASATWKLEAAEGEPLNDCVLTIVGRTTYVAESVKADHYLKVYTSTNGKTYTQVHEFRANDNMDDTQRLTVDLTEAVKGYAQAYVKLEWLVFDSPHLFGIRSVTLTGNTAGIDQSGGSGKMAVSNVQSFTTLPVGSVDVAAINAYKTANLMFGYNKTALLTASEAGEDAYATWKLTAPEGETFEDCYLTLIGKVGYVHADQKDSTSLTVFFSANGEKYSEVKKLTPEENASDSQQYVMDLSAQAYGLSELYVKIYWSTNDDPSCMGLQAMALVANAGEDYALFTPVPENRVITDKEMAGLNSSGATEPTEGTVPGGSSAGRQENPSGGWILWVAVAVAVAAGGIAAWMVLRRKKTDKPAAPPKASDSGNAE